MKKEVILVPMDKCPLDVLADMGEQTRNAWIFLHENAIIKLKQTAQSILLYPHEEYEEMTWEETEKYPETKLFVSTFSDDEWHKVRKIEASDIAFGKSPRDPEHIFFLKMED